MTRGVGSKNLFRPQDGFRVLIVHAGDAVGDRRHAGIGADQWGTGHPR